MDKFIRHILQNYQAKPHGVIYQSAVLLPLIEREGQWHILYQVRSKIVSQPGETSFPGGGIEEGETAQEAAVRETMEELQLSREKIEVLGEIDFLVSAQRVIYCYVGIIKKIAFEEIHPNEEVERLFTLPLDYLIENPPIYYDLGLKLDADLGNFPYHLVPGGKKYPFSAINHHQIPFYEIKDEILWGFTANMTERFINIISNY